MTALGFFFVEAWASLRRGRAASVFAVLAIAVALFVFGGFLLITSALDRVLDAWGRAAELSVYLRDDVTAEQREAIELALDRSGLVAGRAFVSKDEALARFRRDFEELAATTTGLPDNPFPASYEVRLRPGGSAGQDADGLARVVARLHGVADVRYDRQWLARLAMAVRTLRAIGWGLGGVLAIGALLTIATVVRLALHARREEIEIMRLVGSPVAFIRGPFVLEGIVQGGLGALVALVLLAAAGAVVQARYGEALATLIDPAAIRFLSWAQSLLVLVAGMAVGALGGLVAARTVR